jgi:hypothetical protein
MAKIKQVSKPTPQDFGGDRDLEDFNARVNWAIARNDTGELERAMKRRKSQNWGRKVDDE